MWIACYYLPGFGISCEQALRPELMGAPLALAGDDGALRALSTKAAEAGARPGQTPSAARMFCPDLIVLPYDRPRYEEMAEPIWDRIACDSSFVEPVSPEMCFAAFSGAGVYERVLDAADDIGEIARTPVRTGLAFSRFTARTAALRDPGGSPVVAPRGSEAGLLATVPIEDLPRITREERERLKRLGVHVLGDVLAVEERDLYRIFRERSLLLRRLARGMDREPVRALWPPDCVERSLHLECGITDEAMLHEALRRCARHVSEGLIGRGRRCRSLTLMLRSETGRTRIKTEKMQAPKGDEESLFRAALRLLSRMPPLSSLRRGDGGEVQNVTSGNDTRAAELPTSPRPSPCKGEGGDTTPLSSLRRGDGGEVRAIDPPTDVTLRALVAEPVGSVQLALFDENRVSDVLPHERKGRINAAVGFVDERFGKDSIRTAAVLRQNVPFRLWTYPLTRRLNESIEVFTDESGTPVRYRRDGTWWDVAQVQNRWSEAGWIHGRLEERMVFRVETLALGLAELRRCGVEWRLTAVAD